MSDTQEPNITVHKISYPMPISCCLLADTGGPPCNHPPTPRPPWTRRTRWALNNWWTTHRPHIHLGPCDNGDDW